MSDRVIGMVGPAAPREFAAYLPCDAESLPRGLGGSPVNLLTKELLRRGRRVTLFTLDPALAGEQVFRGEQFTVCAGPYRPRARDRALDFFAVERACLRAALAREAPDVVHAQWTYEFALAALAAGRPTVVTAHDAPINVLRHNRSAYRLIRTLMAWRAVRRTARLVAVSPHVEAHLRRYRFLRGDVRVVPNGLPDEVFAPASRAESASRETVFGTVLNGWGHYKNGQAAIAAFAAVRKSVAGARLMMFGAGHGPGEEAERWAVANGMRDGIDFVGMLPHAELLRRVARDVDVLVHPALEEAQPMSVIEAMSQGIPVIGGRHSGGVPWTLDDGRAGILVDVTDPAAIAGAMLGLANDTATRLAWGERGRQLALSRYHIRVVADAYEALYDHACATS